MKSNSVYELVNGNEGIFGNNYNLYLYINSNKYSAVKLNKMFKEYSTNEIINNIKYAMLENNYKNSLTINFSNAKTYSDIDVVLLDLYAGVRKIVAIHLGKKVLGTSLDRDIKNSLTVTAYRGSKSSNEILNYIAGISGASSSTVLPI